jgi:N-acetylglutamate synthase-like GNAT family acetyltransferase
MQSTISLKAPNIGATSDLAVAFVDAVSRLANIDPADAGALTEATGKLVQFALRHAYPPGMDGDIAVEAHLFDGGIRIDVHDWGLPLDLQRHRAGGSSHAVSALDVSDLDLDKLVDEVSFQNLGHDGKLFSVVKHCMHDSPVAASAPLLSEHDDHEPSGRPAAAAADVVVRRFEPGDEEGICQLVFRNYSNTYGAEFFYVPEKLLERNEAGEVMSSVALLDGEIVGHHALLREDRGVLAETGAAVIHPDYKGLGIFNTLALQTLEDARGIGLSAVYAQAVTIHPYSQKAAYTHGYREAAVVVGRARASIRLESNKLTRTGKRHGIVVAYLCFDSEPRSFFLPDLYRDQIVQTYAHCGLELDEARGDGDGEGTAVTPELDAGLNVGTISISRWADGDEAAFGRAFHYLLAKHCDMIYADIDFGSVPNVNSVVEALNRQGFFYSGVRLFGRDGRDQLHMQYENTLDVDEDEIICFSDFAQSLRDFVLEDKRRVVPD